MKIQTVQREAVWSRALGGRRAAGVVVLASLALLACGQPSADGGHRTGQQPLRIGLHSGPVTLDPHRHDEAVTSSILGHVYEGLVGFDPDMGLVPQLALRWENPSDLVWRFYLRPGVRFHDGSPFTAAVAVESLERARRLPGSKIAGYLVAVDAIRALDPQTLEITTHRPYPILLNKLAFVAMVPTGAPPTINRPVGTGRYQLASYEAPTRLSLSGFAEHWGGPPPISEVELVLVADGGARVDALLAGRLDVAHEVAARDLPRLTGAVAPAARTGLLVLYLLTRHDRPPFDDPRVRRAVSLALDRHRLVDEMLAGQGSPAGQLLTRQVFGFDPEIEPPLADPVGARQLLAAAGYADGLDLELEMREGRDPQPIVRQLAEVGLRVRPVARPWPEMYARLAAGEVTFYLGGWACSSGDGSDLLDSMLHSRNAVGGYGDGNFSGYANPQLDRLIEASGATLDMADRLRALRRAIQLATDDLAAIPLVVPHALYGVRTDVVWEPRLDSRVYAFEMIRRSTVAGSPGPRRSG